MTNYLLIIPLSLSAILGALMAEVNADSDKSVASQQGLEKTQAIHDSDNSTPVKVEKMDTPAMEQSPPTMVSEPETQLITEPEMEQSPPAMASEPETQLITEPAMEQSPPTMANDPETQLITEIEKGKGTLLMVIMKEGYIYPAELQMDGVLESYPLKTKVKDYYTGSLLLVTLNRLVLFKEIVNENYQMEFVDDSKWFPLTNFQWDEEEKSFLGQIDSASTWQKYPLSQIRFNKTQ